MSKRLLHLLVALGLVASAFGAVAAPAGAQTDLVGPEEPDSTIYFPWVHNGDMLDGDGPWYSTITVQNVEPFAIDILIEAADGTDLTTASLEAHASKTWSAAALGIASPGEGVVVSAECTDTASVTVTHGDQDDTDTVNLPGWDGDLGSITVKQGATTYSPGDDYNLIKVDDDTIQVDWSPDGDEPGDGSSYTVRYGLDEPLCPRIAGVQKDVMPSPSANAKTSASHVAVSGYSAVPDLDLVQAAADSPAGQRLFILPIIQTNNGWNSIIHITNVADTDNVGVTITFYEAFGAGYGGGSSGSFTNLLNDGETWHFDLEADGGFTGDTTTWVGTAFISADDDIVVSVDRVKPSTMMALTNVAQPYFLADGSAQLYAPLVFRDYNGWNTGINIANLSDMDNTVTLTYYNYAGNAVAVEQVTIAPRSMEYVYRPYTGNVGVAVDQITSVILSGTHEFAAAVDEVKYLSGAGEGHAMSYLAQDAVGGVDELGTLALPLFQRGDPHTGLGDTSGINLFNPAADASSTLAIVFYDQTGLPVAPTVNPDNTAKPIVLTLGALGGATLYAHFYSEMPQGFQGSVVIDKVDGDGMVVGVSNNVNYAVQGDGSAVYQLARLPGPVLEEPTSFQASPEFADNPVTDEDGDPVTHTVLVEVFDQFGGPEANVWVCVDVTAGPNTGEGDCGVSAADGTFTFTYESNGTLGTDTIRVWVDLDDDGVVDDGETDVLIKEWTLGLDRVLTVDQECETGSTETEDCTNTLGSEHTIYATLTDGAGNPVEGVQILAQITAGPNAGEPVTCETTDADGHAVCTYTDANAADGETDTIVVWADLDNMDDLDAEEPSATVTKTWGNPAIS